MKHVHIEKRGRIATVTFDRGSPANALSLELLRDLTEVARSFENDADLSAIILSGRSDNFSMGFDLKDTEFEDIRRAPLAQQRARLMAGNRACAAWEALQPLTISAIEGWCVGGGVALAVATDMRVARRNANVYVPELERGLNMGWGSVPRITNLAGPARAKRLIILAEKLSAERAATWGLVDEIADAGSALAAALDLAKRAASLPPVALRMCKQSINAYATALSAASAHGDVDQFLLAMKSDDFEKAVSAFLEKRRANFSGA